MFERLKILLLGQQPVAKISDHLLDKILVREFGSSSEVVKEKLQCLRSDDKKGHNRISAGILKLAKGDIKNIDILIDTAKSDIRDILINAEYPSLVKIGFEDTRGRPLKRIIYEDYTKYMKWIREGI